MVRKSKIIIFSILAIFIAENNQLSAQETVAQLNNLLQVNQKSSDAFLNGDIPKAIEILEAYMESNDPYQIKSDDYLYNFLLMIVSPISNYAYMIQDHEKQVTISDFMIEIIESKNLTENPEFKELYDAARIMRGSSHYADGNKSIDKGKALSFNDLYAREMYYSAKTLGYNLLDDKNSDLNDKEKSDILNQLLLMHQILEEYDSCLSVIGKMEKVNKNKNYAFEKANIYFLMKEYENATKLYDLIYDTITIDNPNRSTIALQNGICSYKIGNYQKAEELLNDYSIMMTKIGYSTGSNWHFAYLNYEKGDYPEAIKYYKKAIEAVDANPLYKNEKKAYYEMISQLTYGLALCYEKNSQPSLAIENYSVSIENGSKSIMNTLLFSTEQRRNKYVTEYSKRGNDIYHFTYTTHEQYPEMVEAAYDYTLMIKELALNTTRSIRKHASQQESEDYQTIFDHWLTINKNLTLPKPGVNKDSLMDLSRAIEKELVSEIAGQIIEADKLDEIRWKTLQKKLNNNEAAIEFISFNKTLDNSETTTEYAALVLKQGVKYPLYIPICNEKEINSLVSTAIMNNEKDRIDVLYQKNGPALYRLIWSPLENSLKGIEKIYYSPTGTLHSISFDALPYTTEKYLTDKYSLVRLNNTRYIESNFDPSSVKSTSLYGFMDYSDKLFYQNNEIKNVEENTERSFNGLFTPLYATEKEVNSISSMLNETGKKPIVFKKEQAIEEKFYEEIYSSNDIIHVSTHAFYLEPVGDDELFATDLYGMGNLKSNDDPMNRSGIAFSGANYYWMKGEEYPGRMDGILTANEIANLELSGTKLVVLSACETGKGENTKSEGVNGLQKAFKQAGVENLVLSLWKVDDAATQEFMNAFYEFLLKEGFGIEDSMKKAQSLLREKYQNPYYWASFIYVR